MSLWWQRGIIYQVYPRSFMDASGDGVGDLPGVLSRLDYLSALGVDALWLSPIYPSPMKDFGYDVADYTAVDPLFGTLEDFDRLVRAAHARSLKLILDFVPNHSSDEHPWFKAARRSRGRSEARLVPLARPGAGRRPAEQLAVLLRRQRVDYDPHTAQYYYHAFLPEQPDLNWRNPQSSTPMLGVLRFWLDRGVTASAWMSSGISSRTTSSATTRPIPSGAKAWSPIRRFFPC
jgi:alpha-glucosidase